MADASARVRLRPAADISMLRNTRFCTLSRATSMRASFSWMSWNSPIGLPNCTRSFAYCTHSSRHLSMIPSAIAAPRRDVLRLADQPVAPDAHVGEEQLTRRRRVHAHLAQRLGLLEARH